MRDLAYLNRRLARLVRIETDAADDDALYLWELAKFAADPSEKWHEGSRDWGRTELVAMRAGSRQSITTRIKNALHAADAWPMALTATRMHDCGLVASVVRDRTSGRYSIKSARCKARWCSDCAFVKGRRVARRMGELLAKQEVRFVTLTQRSKEETAHAAVSRLQDSYRRLTKLQEFPRMFGGGVSVTEVSRNHDKGTWHAHRHLLVVGHWVDKGRLAESWSVATRDKSLVDIRMDRDADRLINYTTKYVQKPLANLEALSTLDAVDLMHGVAGKKLLATFGRIKGKRLVRVDDDVCHDEEVMTMGEFSNRLLLGNHWAKEIACSIVGVDAERVASEPESVDLSA